MFTHENIADEMMSKVCLHETHGSQHLCERGFILLISMKGYLISFKHCATTTRKGISIANKVILSVPFVHNFLINVNWWCSNNLTLVSLSSITSTSDRGFMVYYQYLLLMLLENEYFQSRWYYLVILIHLSNVSVLLWPPFKYAFHCITSYNVYCPINSSPANWTRYIKSHLVEWFPIWS